MTARVVATAGHVDHGKSTLVRALTGTDPDRWEEERRRGLTIDLGFARTTTPDGTLVDLVDVPGHVRFLKNMLAGAGGVDACILVVAATEGWKPQTEEHLRVLDLLGIGRGVVVLTMAGRVDEARVDQLAVEVAERTAGTFLAAAEIVAVDSVGGQGLAEVREALARVVAATPGAEDVGRPRLWIDRAFSLPGAGTVVTGTLTGGSLAVGDPIEIETDRGPQSARIRSLQSFGEDHEQLEPGRRAALNLTGVSHHDLSRGDAVVRPGQWHRAHTFDASLTTLPSLGRPVRGGSGYLVHIGSGEHTVRLQVLGDGHRIGAGATACVRVHLPRDLPLLPGDRFILRETGTSETVGGGAILDVDPVLRARAAQPDRSVDRVVRERGWVTVAELERLTGARREPTIGSWAVDPAVLEVARGDLRRRVGEAGALGLDVAGLEPHERAVLDAEGELHVEHGRARMLADEPEAAHPFVTALAAAPFAPPSPVDVGVDRATVRDLIRRGQIVEEGGIVFAATAVDQAAAVIAALLDADPAGVTVARVREALGTSRKFALPLLALLDRGGVTRRRGDLRVAGPRLPAPS